MGLFALASLATASALTAAPQDAWIEHEVWGPWAQVFGRLHFALVHFPIGLLIAAGVVELCRTGRKGPRPGSAALVCLGLGWLSAALAAYSGWTYADVERHGHAADGLLYWHRWGGIVVAGAAFLTWTVGLLGRSGTRGWARSLFAFLLLVTTVLTGVVGHLGGSLVNGEEYLTEPFTDAEKARRLKGRGVEAPEPEVDEPVAPEVPTESSDPDPGLQAAGAELDTGDAVATALVDGTTEQGQVPEAGGDGVETLVEAAGLSGIEGDDVEPQESDPAPAEVASLSEAEAYAAVEPVLELTCYHCHGSRKGKAGLRMHEVERLFEGEPSEWVVVPGHPEKSELLRRISLPGDHEDVMPSDDDPLAAEEIAQVAAWIAAMDPVERGLPADGGGAGALVLGDWAEAGGVSGGGSTESLEEQTPDEQTPDEQAPDEQTTAAADAAGDEATGAEAAVADGVESVEPAVAQDVDARLAALVQRGAVAQRVAADSDAVDVVFGLLRADVTDADLALLEGLESTLVSLDLSRTAVTDAGLASLAGFPRLQRLRLDETGIGDAGVAHLRGLQDLQYLNLVGTAVGDEGLGELAELEALERVFLWRTAVTDAGVGALREALPELEVVRDLDLPGPPPELVVVEGETTFADHAGPILAASCVECHGAEDPAAGLRYDSFEAIFEGTWAEWSVKPGEPDISRMLIAVQREPGEKSAMPKKGDRLTPEQIATLAAWVADLREEPVSDQPAPETDGDDAGAGE